MLRSGDLKRLRGTAIGAAIDGRSRHDRAGRHDGGEAQLQGHRHPGPSDGLACPRNAGGADHGDRDQRSSRLAQAVARPVDQLADRAGGELHRTRNLLVTSALELALDDCFALGCGQITDRDHQGGEPFATLERLRRLLHAVVVLVELLVVPGDALFVDRRIADDPEEPGPEKLGLRARPGGRCRPSTGNPARRPRPARLGPVSRRTQSARHCDGARSPRRPPCFRLAPSQPGARRAGCAVAPPQAFLAVAVADRNPPVLYTAGPWFWL